ncbi:unnamed protein product [Microthlaspi erraticum]|uniref:Reverse transcriptase zinc-binding domain-containing protein n=1 Tax=Microthlaspi erraticum TaxID=1685480 RepID=A0A6D2JVR1_9BRAS|nr:unnamed protein product [Microthlaspi erraticum]
MAMPMYAMTCFKLPVKLCKDLTSAMMTYWWSTEENKSKIHWVGWEKLTLPKKAGGLGFRDIQVFNQALLAKQAWRLLHDPQSLFSRFFKSRYYADGDLLSASSGRGASYGWRSIIYGRELLRKGLRRSIGNGKATLVWVDNWLYDGIPSRPGGRHSLMNIELRVSDLIDETRQNWNMTILRELFNRDDIELICRQRPYTSREDSFVWTGTKNGVYTVKTGYDLMSKIKHKDLYTQAEAQPSMYPIYEKCWKVKSTPKIKVFMWKACSGSLAVMERLRTRGIRGDLGCLLCQHELESINHILFECPQARLVWALSNVPSPENGFCSSLFENLNLFGVMARKDVPEDIRSVPPWVLWVLWKNRNAMVFEGKRFEPHEVVGKAFDDARQWSMAQNRVENIIPATEPVVMRWSPPETGHFKCNIEFSWSQSKAISGASWVLRDSLGTVLCHSRRSYTNVSTCFDAKIRSWEWALQCMKDMHRENVPFGIIDGDHQRLLINHRNGRRF